MPSRILLLSLLAATGCSLASDFDFTFRDTPDAPDGGDGNSHMDEDSGTPSSDGGDGGDGDDTPPDPLCETAGCSPDATCSVVSDVAVCTCKRGFYDMEGDGTRCIDLNECAAGVFECQSNASCVNTPGSYSCECDLGYAYNASSQECLDGCIVLLSTTCNPEVAVCTKPEGAAVCRCKAGYTDLKGDGSECVEDKDCLDLNCDPHAQCSSAGGDPKCECGSGYEGSGQTCSDIDECAEGTHNCDSNAECTNTDGGFACACKAGWSGTGRKGENGEPGCVDVNECTTGAHNCNPLASCTNTTGGYTCTCPAGGGYIGNGVGANGCCLRDGTNTDQSHPNDGKDNECNGTLDRALIASAFPQPGSATHAGDLRIQVTPSVLPNATLECRHYRLGSSPLPVFSTCASPVVHPADPRLASTNGAWRTEVRWKFPGGVVSEAASHEYYLHNSIAGRRYLAGLTSTPTPRCADKATDAAWFNAADAKLQASLVGAGFTDPGAFDNTTFLRNPFVTIGFKPLTVANFALRNVWRQIAEATKDATPSFNADILSLRHRFTRSPNGRYILITRTYPSRTRYDHDEDGKEDCKALTIRFSQSHWLKNAAKKKVDCDAVVVNRAGVGVCLNAPAKIVHTAPSHAFVVHHPTNGGHVNPQDYGYADANKYMWRNLIDEGGWHDKYPGQLSVPGFIPKQTGYRNFSEKCDVQANCTVDDVHELFLPDRAVLRP